MLAMDDLHDALLQEQYDRVREHRSGDADSFFLQTA
jgi:hypothetical protein